MLIVLEHQLFEVLQLANGPGERRELVLHQIQLAQVFQACQSNWEANRSCYCTA